MTEERHRIWDIAISALGSVLTAVAILVGVHQFNTQRDRELATARANDAIEFKRRIWEKQRDAYTSLSAVVGEIAAVADRPKELQAAADRFTALYWGTMLLVEDENVRDRAIRFNVELRDYKAQNSTIERLKKRADYLIEACRESSEHTWQEVKP